jgi:transcriptional regulator with XRE-family HTH domain
MSPRRFAATPRSTSVDAATRRLWVTFGQHLRDARAERRWTIAELAGRAGVSAGMVHRVESGLSASSETAVRLVTALGLRLDFEVSDPRRRSRTLTDLSVDAVHSVMGEFEAAHLRRPAVGLGIDEPYQHYQFAGRADLAAWSLESAALLHVENRTRFPDLQGAAGAFNAKRAYLADAIGARLGVRRWASQTHVMAVLWSAEVLHVLRLRRETFRALCPDPPDAFAAWWSGESVPPGARSELVVIDPLATARQRPYVGLDDALTARPRYRSYAEAAARLLPRGRPVGE